MVKRVSTIKMRYHPGTILVNKDSSLLLVLYKISENIFYCAFVLSDCDIMYLTVPISFLDAFTVMT